MRFRFISDPGHGWLEVPRALVVELSLLDKISGYSYQHRDQVYLEEDCDAYLLIQRLREQRREYQLEEVYQDPTPIRRYQRFQLSASEQQALLEFGL